MVKLANLQVVHEKMPGEAKGKMSSLATVRIGLYFLTSCRSSDAIEGYTKVSNVYSSRSGDTTVLIDLF